MTLRWNQRGVGVLDATGNDERIYWGTGDGYLIAVDAKTGRPIDELRRQRPRRPDGRPAARQARHARLSQRADLLRAVAADRREGHGHHAGGDLVADQDEGADSRAGFARFDARTGKVRWTFHTVPQKGEFGSDTWQDGSNEYAGKVTVWTIMSADEELGLSVPADQHRRRPISTARIGSATTCSRKASSRLDLNTGKRVWHFQTVHHGLWDYDNPAAPNLLDITVNGTRDQGAGADHQAGLRLHVRSRHRQAGLADRRAAGAAVRCAGREGVADAAVSDEAGAVRVSGRHGQRSRRLHAGDPRDGGRRRSKDSGSVRCSRRRRSRARMVAAGHDRRRELVGRRGRSGDRACCTCRRGTPSRSASSSPPDTALDSNLLYMQTPGRNPQMPEGLPLFKPPYSRMTAIDMNTGNHAWMVPTGAGDRIRNNPR